MRFVVAIYLWLSVVTGTISYNSQHELRATSAGFQREIWEKARIRGSAGQDARYSLYRANATRVLVPTCIAGLESATGLGWDRSFFLFRITTIFAAYLAFHIYTGRWFSPAISLCATLFMVATLPLTFNLVFEIPTDFVEILTYTLGLWCIRDRREGWLCLVIAVGTLSRETTFFLPLILLICSVGRGSILSVIMKVVAAGLSWLVPFGTLRWWTGLNLRYNHGNSLEHNIVGIRLFFTNLNPYNNYLYYFYIFGIFWVLPFLYRRRLPFFLRRAILSVPAFVLVYLFCGGFMNEAREIVNLYPLLIPAGIFAISEGPSHPDLIEE